jgi:hypothetical protein
MLVVLWAALIHGATRPRTAELARPVASITAATLASLAIAIAVCVVRPMPARDAGGAARSLVGASNHHWQVAAALRALGVGPGTKVAYVGDAMDAYWARLARVRIVAEIPARGGGARRFLEASPHVAERAFAALARTPADVVVVHDPEHVLGGADWEPVGGPGDLRLRRLAGPSAAAPR